MIKYTFKDFLRDCPDDDTCLEWLKNERWPTGIYCEACEKKTKHYKIESRKSYSCEFCGNHVHPTAGTIYHKSSTDLSIWFYTAYLMAQTRGGISAKQIERETGVTYKTAWRMCKLIRQQLGEDYPPFDGDVEMDESYFGGKRKGKRGRGAAGKTAVFGISQRGGKVHTNTIEVFWSDVKNGIRGVFHSVSPKYLKDYINEYAFRYNHRNDTTPMFLTFLRRMARLTGG